MTDEELKSRMDRIIEWVKTCDTKASIMLTLVCLIASFIFTSDYILNGITDIVKSWRNYKFDSCCISDINISGVIAIVSLFMTLYFISGSIYRFVMVLYSKIDESLTDSSLKKIIYRVLNALFQYSPQTYNLAGAKYDSLIHFNHIANMNYADFKAAVRIDPDENQQSEIGEDITSQIYINACRCQEKFNDYNAAVRWMLYSAPFLLLLYLSLIFFQAR